MPRSRRLAAAVLAPLVVAGAVACAPADPPPSGPGVRLPAGDAPFDYQLGDPYPPPEGTEIVVRDREAEPAGLYDVCYVNGFQVQPHELAWWEADHPDLLLSDDGGYVVDGAWDEVLLDISSEAKRASLAEVVGGWIDGCAARGFEAVEPDNLDSHTRSAGLLTPADAEAFARLLTARAHEAGLAIAQKNDAELAPQGPSLGFDFAIAEECNRWSECDAYADAYAGLVYVVEYDDADFDTGCRDWPQLSIVRRDVLLTPPGSSDHRYAAC
jgi:hypothetical protein